MKKDLNRTTLLLVCGLPGTGKSSLSARIAAECNIMLIDKDVLQDPFTVDRRGEEYAAVKKQTYQVGYDLAELNLSCSNSVLLDFPFSRGKYFEHTDWESTIQSIAERTDAIVKVIWCVCDNAVRLERIRKRGLRRDELQMKEHEQADTTIPAIPFRHLLMDTTKGVDESYRDFLYE